MYKKILNAPLRLPPFLSPNTRSILTRLLDRDVSRRLGHNGAAEIKQHPFFAGMDWERVYHKEIPVEFIPNVQHGQLDTGNIDAEFKYQNALDTPEDNPVISKLNFSQFTYVKPNSGNLTMLPH